jgi:hypothetical protein
MTIRPYFYRVELPELRLQIDFSISPHLGELQEGILNQELKRTTSDEIVPSVERAGHQQGGVVLKGIVLQTLHREVPRDIVAQWRAYPLWRSDHPFWWKSPLLGTLDVL